MPLLLILAEGRGSKLARDLARSGSKSGDSVMPDTPYAPALLPVPGRSRDKPRSYALRAEARLCLTEPVLQAEAALW